MPLSHSRMSLDYQSNKQNKVLNLFHLFMVSWTVDAGQDFSVIVDYAHWWLTSPSSMKTFPTSRKIAVLGSTGGRTETHGKRPVLGRLRMRYCDEIIITSEPVRWRPDENYWRGCKGVTTHTPTIILDRRGSNYTCFVFSALQNHSLHNDIERAAPSWGPHGTKEVWDDATVAKRARKDTEDTIRENPALRASFYYLSDFKASKVVHLPLLGIHVPSTAARTEHSHQQDVDGHAIQRKHKPFLEIFIRIRKHYVLRSR